MEFDIVRLGILCVFIFFASFVDAIAGGGGIISSPAYLALGFPPHITLGTGKFSSFLSTTVPIYRYGKSGKINWKSASVAMVACVVGSYIGSVWALSLSEKVLQIVMMSVLPFVAAFIIFRKDNKKAAENGVPAVITKDMMIKAGIIGFFVGIYEGLLGPGSGTFLIIGFTTWLGFDLINASGTAKVVNFAGTITAAITFMFSGNVYLEYAIPTAICGMLGSYYGAGLALKNGEKVIRPIMILVIVLLFAKVIFDFISQI